jgi:hypothetical protein
MIDKTERKAELEQQLAEIEAKIAERRAHVERREAMILEHWQKRADRIKAQIEALNGQDEATGAD